jgi:hypothetical protein
VSNKLTASGSNLTQEQVIARATAMTCAGCHNPSSFGLTNQNAIGPGERWPDTLGFTHINEFSFNGVFPLSSALTDNFLPVRKEEFRQYLLTTPENAVQVKAMMLPAKATSAVKSGKRSG